MTWELLAKDRADELRIQITRCYGDAACKGGTPAPLAAAELTAAQSELDAAETALEDPASREVVWAKLHRAEQHVCNAIDDPLQLVLIAEDHARRNLSKGEAAEALRELLAATDDTVRMKRARALIGRCHEVAASHLESQRHQAVALWVVSAALLAGAIVAVIAQNATGTPVLPLPVIAADPVDVSAKPAPGISAAQTLMWVMGFGALGGLLGTVLMYARRTKLTDTRWFDPIWSLLAIKVTFGIWFAVIGVLAVATGALVAEYQSFGAVLLLAAGFGYSQQVVTGLFDRRAEAWAEPAEQKDDAALTP